jgi:hypothetical protein
LFVGSPGAPEECQGYAGTRIESRRSSVKLRAFASGENIAFHSRFDGKRAPSNERSKLAIKPNDAEINLRVRAEALDALKGGTKLLPPPGHDSFMLAVIVYLTVNLQPRFLLTR